MSSLEEQAAILTLMCGMCVSQESVVDYPSKPRDKWLFDWPSQVILVVNQIFWCQEVEQVSASWMKWRC